MHAENSIPVPVRRLKPATMARRFGIGLLSGSGFRKSYNPTRLTPEARRRVGGGAPSKRAALR